MTPTTIPGGAMTAAERKASLSLASIFALRMLGLFVILPVFAVYAHELPGGDNDFWVGITLGIYGLTQGVLQIPFGAASDRYGRKPVIAAGLLLFAVGSFAAAASHTIHGVMIGRMLQGAGAVSAAVTAAISDLVRDRVLMKAMAMIGSSIGLTFALSLVISPPLTEWCGVDGLFTITGILALAAVLVVWKIVPPIAKPRQKESGAKHARWSEIVFDPQLLRLNFGIFCLHAALTSIFVVVPGTLARLGLVPAEHWKVYLPAVLIGFGLMAPFLIFGNRRGCITKISRFMIAMMALVLAACAYCTTSVLSTGVLLALFFTAFNVLEATLPGLISKASPPADKGFALGVYNTTQNIGLFIGGAVGGWISQTCGAAWVFLASTFAILLWLASAFGLKEPALQPREPGEAIDI